MILEVAVIPRPGLDDFRSDGARGASAGQCTNDHDSAISAHLAIDVAVLEVFPNDSAVPVESCLIRHFDLAKAVSWPLSLLLGANCNLPSSRDCTFPVE